MTTTVAPLSSRAWNTPSSTCIQPGAGHDLDGSSNTNTESVWSPADLAGQLQTLGFAAGRLGVSSPKSGSQAQLLQDSWLLADRFHVPAKIDGCVHVHHFSSGSRPSAPPDAGQFYQSGRPGIAGTTAVRAGDVPHPAGTASGHTWRCRRSRDSAGTRCCRKNLRLCGRVRCVR